MSKPTYPNETKEYRKALKDRLSPPCGKPYKQLLHHTNVAAAEAGAKQKLVCYDCGIACDLEGMKKERLYYLRRMNAWAPPQTAPASRHPSAKPLTKSFVRCGSSNQAESPTAACMATETGNAPVVIRSLTIVATVSTPMLS